MALFGLGKKKKVEQEKRSSGVKILGGGCTKCNQLEDATSLLVRYTVICPNVYISSYERAM